MGSIRALSPERKRVYVLKENRDAGEDNQVRWLYQLLPYPAHVKAQDRLVEFRGNIGREEETRTIVLTGSQEKTVLLNGIVGVENFIDEDGKEKHWPDKGSEDEKMKFLSCLKPTWRRELAAAILGDSDFTEEQAGNSDSRSALK